MKAAPISAIVFGALVLALAGARQGGAGGQTGGGAKSVQALIDDLGHPSYKIREQATRELRKLSRVPPELEQAALSPDPEVRTRALILLKHIRQGYLNPLDRVLAQGPLDELIDRTVLSKTELSPDQIRALLNWSKRLMDLANEKAGKTLKVEAPWSAPKETSLCDIVSEKALGAGMLLLGNSVSCQSPGMANAIICRGKITSFYGPINSFVMSNEALEFGTKDRTPVLRGCVVFCDGNVGRANFEVGILIANGDVQVDMVDKAVIIASGKVKAGYPVRSSAILQDQGEFVQQLLFDERKHGIEVAEAKDQVSVKSVGQDTAFARAGLKSGDQILQMDGQKLESRQQFRRAVRRMMVEQRAVRLQVLRAKQHYDILLAADF